MIIIKSIRRDKGKLGQWYKLALAFAVKGILNPVILLPCCILRP